MSYNFLSWYDYWYNSDGWYDILLSSGSASYSDLAISIEQLVVVASPQMYSVFWNSVSGIDVG